MNTLINPKQVNVLVFSLGLFAATSIAQGGEINTGYFGEVAIKGYDPVAYFTEEKAMQGSKDISHRWLGAVWNFSSEEHKSLFAESPVKYAPQYGGYCAGGLAYGDSTVNIDPEAWRIIDGKLYLNYDPGTAAELEEIDGHLEKTVENWPEIKAAMANYNQ